MIRHTIADYYRGSRRRPEVISAHNVPGSADDFDDRWLAEWQKHILEQSLIILRSTVHEGTFQAFQLTALEQRPPAEVAAFLQISVQNVYEARSRCMEQLRKIVRDLSEKY